VPRSGRKRVARRTGLGRLAGLMIVAALAFAAAGCSSADPTSSVAGATSPTSGVLVVAVDDSLAAAFAIVKPAYEAATPGAKLTYRFGPSKALLKSIEGGEAVDLFFAGDLATGQAIVTDRLAAGPAVPFAIGASGATSSVVILANSADVVGAAAFVRWLDGPAGQVILQKFGLAPPS
jgi:ABC-type molybdate transport system substrate-binding protein